MTPKQRADRWAELRRLLGEYRMVRCAIALTAVRGEAATEWQQQRLSAIAVDVVELVDRIDGSAP